MIPRRTEAENHGQGQPAARGVIQTFSDRFTSAQFNTETVSIWIADIRRESSASSLDDLCHDERERAKGYVMPAIREQFIASRSVLRRLLGRQLGTVPHGVELTTRADGKPVLADPNLKWHFNVAHSNGWAVIAIGSQAVGVDIEVEREIPNAENLVKRFFSPGEREQYLSLPDNQKHVGFLRGWTCKEAVLKGTGAGMRAVDACTVCLDPTLPPRLIHYAGRPEDERWGLGVWRPAAGMVAAVAVEGFGTVVLE